MKSILVDTDIWCNYFRYGNPHITQLIEHDLIATHPLIIGELAVGNLIDRDQTIQDLRAFHLIKPTTDEETHLLLKHHRLWEEGIQWNDLLILASAIASPGTLLWTQNRRLAKIAQQFSISYHPE
ncbi:MAG: type II toxin-antitoxin system VapC family toxin [Akkermansiaceae bacterium]